MAEEIKFTIHQTGGSGELDQVHDFLKTEKRIARISEQWGQHYSVPDRDDLPEWEALWVYVKAKDFDDFKAYVDDLQDRLFAALGSQVMNKVSVMLA